MPDYYGNLLPGDAGYNPSVANGNNYYSSQAWKDAEAAGKAYQAAQSNLGELMDQAGDKPSADVAAAIAQASAKTTSALQTFVQVTNGQERSDHALLRQSTGVDTRDTPEKKNIEPHETIRNTPTDDAPMPEFKSPADMAKQKSLLTAAAVAFAVWKFLL